MFRRLVLALCALVAAGVFVSAEARRYRGGGDRLVVLTEHDVDMNRDTFTIDVSTAKGAYKGIRIKNVRGYLFDVRRVKVVYADGTVHNENRQIDMYRGERSRPINPTWKSQFIDKVVIEMEPGRGRGRIQVLGIQSRRGRMMDRDGENVSSSYGDEDDGRTNLATRPTSSRPTEAKTGKQTAGGDVLFGAQYVGFGVDRDVIKIGSQIGKFDRIRFRVLDNDIYIREIRVVYTDGETDALAVNAEIPKNSRTSWIPIQGDSFIREIQMIYRSRPSFSGQARIEVFGDYAPNWLGPDGEGRKYNEGWVLLGAQTAGFVGFDRDIIPVGRNEGGFEQIRVSVRDRAITLNEVKIVYVNGEEEAIPIRTRVDAGGTYGPIELRGRGRRAIERLEAKYRSRFFDSSAVGKGAAIVEIWARH